MDNQNSELMPMALEAGIVRPQVSSMTKRQMSTKVKSIGKELLHVNQLLNFQKEGNEIADWAESINELMPDIEAGHVKFVLDCMKMSILEYNRNEGIQNIFTALKETANFYQLVKDENYFRQRRAEYVKRAFTTGQTAIQTLIARRYAKVMNQYLVQDIRNALKDKKERILNAKAGRRPYVRHRMEDAHPFGCPDIKARKLLFKSVAYSYGHPSFTAHQLYSHMITELRGRPLFPDFNKLITHSEAIKAYEAGRRSAFALAFL